MSSTTEQIKSKLDIVTVVGGYIKLEKAGANFKARCPFHNEKTPSFFVSPDRGSYYCFGCQAKGDIFTFVQEFEGLDFPGALKVLADRAGVTLETFTRGDSTETSHNKETLFSLSEQATFYFEKNLGESKEARDYLASRGVTEETIATFRLGYAKPEWRGLHDFLLSKGAEPSDLLSAGLVKERGKGAVANTYASSTLEANYDTFRSRIMFPLADSSGRVVAFSGRIFPEVPKSEQTDRMPPKYLNSPETAIFKKSEVLYGLDKAKKDIHQRDYSILVEGQMDLVMLHQAGFTNTVAGSGTALTVTHLTRLQRLSNRIIMAYDGDSAGFQAVIRGAEIALSLGMEVKVAIMVAGSDPADMALHDKEGLAKSIKDARHVISFILGLTVSKYTDARTRARAVVADVLPFVARLPSASEQGYFVKEISGLTGIKEDAVWEDLRRTRTDTEQTRTDTEVAAPIQLHRSDRILKKLAGILWWQKEKKNPNAVMDDIEKKIREHVPEKSFEQFENEKNTLIFEAEAYYNDDTTHLEKDVAELLHNLVLEGLKKEFEQAMALLHTAEAQGNTEESARLFALCTDISKKINDIKNVKE